MDAGSSTSLIIGSAGRRQPSPSALAPLCAEGARIAVSWNGARTSVTRSSPVANWKWRKSCSFSSGAIGNRDQTLNVACARGYGGSTLAYVPARRSKSRRQRSLEHWGTRPAGRTPIFAPRACGATSSRTTSTSCRRGHQREQPACSPPAAGRSAMRSGSFRSTSKAARAPGMCNMGCPNQAEAGHQRAAAGRG